MSCEPVHIVFFPYAVCLGFFVRGFFSCGAGSSACSAGPSTNIGGSSLRMVFSVMLPMIIGPAIGAQVIKGNAQTYLDLGQTKTVPTPAIFLAAAGVLLLTAIPLWLLKRAQQKTTTKEEEAVC